MASETLTSPTAQSPEPVQGWGPAWALPAAALLAIVAAHLPLLGLQCSWMWDDPEYNVFPLVWVGAALLIWRDTRSLGPLRPGNRKWALRWLGAECVLLALAG